MNPDPLKLPALGKVLLVRPNHSSMKFRYFQTNFCLWLTPNGDLKSKNNVLIKARTTRKVISSENY